MTQRLAVVSLLGMLLLVSSVFAQPDTFTLERVLGGLDLPTDLAFADDGRLFVSEKRGRIVMVENGTIQGVFLDLRDRVRPSSFDEGEQGLLSIALHPDFAQNGLFFVVYTDHAEDSVVARFRRRAGDPSSADPSSERVLLRIEQPEMNHNVNAVRFGPDGFLYVSTGDGGFLSEPLCTSQHGDSLLGKILRLDVDQGAGQPPYYTIPASNPFAGPDGVRDEIWALGLRNPWRFSFDRLTGDLYIGDPGQTGSLAREEIDFEPAFSGGGRNYGWKMWEGTLCRGSSAGCGTTLPPCDADVYFGPVLEYRHDAADRCAVVGGYVYRGQAIAGLDGDYVFGDYCGQLWLTTQHDAWSLRAMEPALPGLMTFGEDPSGELFVATLSGEVFHIAGTVVGHLEAGEVSFTTSHVEVDEAAGTLAVTVVRAGGLQGPVSARIVSESGSATAGDDFEALNVTVAWTDGEGGPKTVSVALVDDAVIEGTEALELRIVAAAGGLVVAAPAELAVTLVDDDLPGICVPDPFTLCLGNGRFLARVDWRTSPTTAGAGTAVPITTDGGWFWFFRETNPEVFVKVLDACSNHGFFWVFAGGMTDVENRLTVVDTETGVVKVYPRAAGEPYGTLRDTRAFATCSP